MAIVGLEMGEANPPGAPRRYLDWTMPAEVMSDPELALSDFKAPNGEVWAWRAGLRDRKGGDPAEWPEELRVREFPESATVCA